MRHARSLVSWVGCCCVLGFISSIVCADDATVAPPAPPAPLCDCRGACAPVILDFGPPPTVYSPSADFGARVSFDCPQPPLPGLAGLPQPPICTGYPAACVSAAAPVPPQCTAPQFSSLQMPGPFAAPPVGWASYPLPGMPYPHPVPAMVHPLPVAYVPAGNFAPDNQGEYPANYPGAFAASRSFPVYCPPRSDCACQCASCPYQAASDSCPCPQCAARSAACPRLVRSAACPAPSSACG